MTQFDESTQDGFHTGGMIALLPDVDSADRLAHPAGFAPGELHLTLAYLGDDVTRWSVPAADAVQKAAAAIAALDEIGVPLYARAWSHMTLNPDAYEGREPCAAYGIGDSDALVPLHDRALAIASAFLASAGRTLPEQHQPFVPHVTAGEGLDAGSLHYVGGVRFDRLVVALGPRWIEVRP